MATLTKTKTITNTASGALRVTAKTNVLSAKAKANAKARAAFKALPPNPLTTDYVPASVLSKQIKNYGSLSVYERQKALAALSVPRTLTKLASNSKAKAKRDGKAFDLTGDDLMDLWKAQKGLCKYTNMPLDLGAGTHKNPNQNRVSVDRVRNSEGYVKGNVVLTSWQANQAKGSGTRARLYKFAHAVVATGRTR